MDTLPKDPVMRLSVVNTWLRDMYGSFDSLAEDKGIDKKELEDSLSAIGYAYDVDRNQFV